MSGIHSLWQRKLSKFSQPHSTHKSQPQVRLSQNLVLSSAGCWASGKAHNGGTWWMGQIGHTLTLAATWVVLTMRHTLHYGHPMTLVATWVALALRHTLL